MSKAKIRKALRDLIIDAIELSFYEDPDDAEALEEDIGISAEEISDEMQVYGPKLIAAIKKVK